MPTRPIVMPLFAESSRASALASARLERSAQRSSRTAGGQQGPPTSALDVVLEDRNASPTHAHSGFVRQTGHFLPPPMSHASQESSRRRERAVVRQPTSTGVHAELKMRVCALVADAEQLPPLPPFQQLLEEPGALVQRTLEAGEAYAAARTHPNCSP